MSLVVDTITYAVNITVVNRKPAFEYKYAERTADGVLHSEIIGTYYNFDIECGMSKHSVADYAALYLKLTEPVETHEITVPGAPSGYGTFDCYFANIKDQVARYQKDGVDYFRNLSFSVIATEPARTPA